jgi:hypothetical protein
MSNQRIEQCRDDYMRTSGYNVFRQRTMIFPVGWKEVVSRYEHAQLWPLNTKMISSQKIRFMLLEQTYSLSPKWLDASGNNGIDNVAAESYDNIINRLRHGLKTVYVNDVEQVLNRGRRAQGSAQQYQNREQDYDNMSLAEVKQLVRVAMQDWEVEKHRLANMNPSELVHEQILAYDVTDLRARVALLPAADPQHPAAAIAGQLENMQLEGELMNDAEMAVAFQGIGVNAAVGAAYGGSNVNAARAEPPEVPPDVPNFALPPGGEMNRVDEAHVGDTDADDDDDIIDDHPHDFFF